MCSLWITVARTDTSFMEHTIPHLVKMCNYDFCEKVLAIDTSPLSGEKAYRPGLGSIEDLRNICKQLESDGIIDKIVEIDYLNNRIKQIYKKHLNTSRVKATHNYKGYPVYGSAWCIEEAKGDYFLHFDSDMLLYQQKGFDWIAEGIDILKRNSDIICARPQAGPQTDQNNMYTQVYNLQKNQKGFYRIKGFTSRCFLIDRKRFENLLPMKVMWAKRQGRLKDRMPRWIKELYSNLMGKGFLDSWEKMITESMNCKGFSRADISDNKSWALHPHDHGKKFLEKLHSLINKVETGKYPSAQAGHYNLNLDLW